MHKMQHMEVLRGFLHFQMKNRRHKRQRYYNETITSSVSHCWVFSILSLSIISQLSFHYKLIILIESNVMLFTFGFCIRMSIQGKHSLALLISFELQFCVMTANLPKSKAVQVIKLSLLNAFCVSLWKQIFLHMKEARNQYAS